MDFDKMSDKELAWEFSCETDPYQMLKIAEHVKDEKLRQEMQRRAHRLRHSEDDDRW